MAAEQLDKSTPAFSMNIASHLDIVNREMALIRFQVPIDSKTGFGRYSAFDIFRLRRLLSEQNRSKKSLDNEELNFLKGIFSLKGFCLKKRQSTEGCSIRFSGSD